MSRRGKGWAVVSLAVALVFLVPLCLRWHEQWKLAAYRKKLIASGEKLTVEELMPKRRGNGTAKFLKLAAKVRPFWQYQPSAMIPVKPGVASVVWRQARLMDSVDLSKPPVDIWPGLKGAVQTNQQSLDDLATVVDDGGFDFMEDSLRQNASGNRYNYLAEIKRTVADFSARAMLALHEGQQADALRFLAASVELAQTTAKDPSMIDQLVSDACLNIALTRTWEALQADGWTDEQLAQMQRPWDQTSLLDATEKSFAMERARSKIMFQDARASRHGLDDLMGSGSPLRDNAEIWHDFLLNGRQGINELLAAYPRYWGWRWIWSYRDEQRYLEFMQTVIDTIKEAQKRKNILPSVGLAASAKEGQTGEETMNLDVVESIESSMKKCVFLALRAQTGVNIVRAAIALERYRLTHHVYPGVLRDLVPSLMAQVPVDCMDGQDLRYRLNPDGTYLLYSVGEDGIDNGGDATPQKDKVLSFFNGRDLVWPRPATAEEVQEAEQSKKIRRR